MFARLPILATGFAGCMTLMAAFLGCVLLWAIWPLPGLHALLPYILIGYPAVTPVGILAGLLASFVIGNLLGWVFAISFNTWSRLTGRAAAGAAQISSR